MSRLRKYPGDSDQPPRDPFSDEQGKNPFADREPASADAAGPSELVNPYQGGVGGLPAHVVGGFETMLPHRGGTVLLLGILGVVCAAAFSFCWPILALNLLLTLPAWLMGQSDLRAMRAGAMNREGRGMTLAGYILGIVGTVATVVLFVTIGWYAFRMASPW